MIVKKFTADYKRDLLAQADESFFFFASAIYGLDKLGEAHYHACRFLEGRGPAGRWLRAVLLLYRGFYKSVLGVQAFSYWQCLHARPKRCAVKIIGNSSDNIRDIQFKAMLDAFQGGPQSGLLQWLYSERIPENFRGWNTETISFIQRTVSPKPSITYWGVQSKFEGWHGNVIICDDLEGAEAEGSSGITNEQSWLTYNRAKPLVEDHTLDQILLIGTPHGDNPTVYRAIDSEAETDNRKRIHKVFFLPALAPNGKPYEPQKFPPEVVEMLSKDPIWDEQYLLRRRSRRLEFFSQPAIEKFAYEWESPGVVRYIGGAFDAEQLARDGYPRPRYEWRSARVDRMRIFMHVDPTHRLQAEMSKNSRGDRPSLAAIAVVGIADDFNGFVLDAWMKDADLPELAAETMRLARKWNPDKLSFEAIGAQLWFKHYLEQQERIQRQAIVGMLQRGVPRDRIRPWRSIVQRLHETQRDTTVSKEWVLREGLAPWVNFGALHFDLNKHHERLGGNAKGASSLIEQMLRVAGTEVAIDVIDAIAQGPEIWKPPVLITPERQRAAERNFVEQIVRQKVYRRGAQRPAKAA